MRSWGAFGFRVYCSLTADAAQVHDYRKALSDFRKALDLQAGIGVARRALRMRLARVDHGDVACRSEAADHVTSEARQSRHHLDEAGAVGGHV